MPYVDGETLRTKLKRETQRRADEALRIVTEQTAPVAARRKSAGRFLMIRDDVASGPPLVVSATNWLAVQWAVKR
jgi:hypothetical protein